MDTKHLSIQSFLGVQTSLQHEHFFLEKDIENRRELQCLLCNFRSCTKNRHYKIIRHLDQTHLNSAKDISLENYVFLPCKLNDMENEDSKSVNRERVKTIIFIVVFATNPL